MCVSLQTTNVYAAHDPDSFYSQPPQHAYDGYPDDGANDSRLLGDSLHGAPVADADLRGVGGGAHDAYQGLSFAQREPLEVPPEAPYEPLYMHSRTQDPTHVMPADVTMPSSDAVQNRGDATAGTLPPDAAPVGDFGEQQMSYRYTSQSRGLALRSRCSTLQLTCNSPSFHKPYRGLTPIKNITMF